MYYVFIKACIELPNKIRYYKLAKFKDFRSVTTFASSKPSPKNNKKNQFGTCHRV